MYVLETVEKELIDTIKEEEEKEKEEIAQTIQNIIEKKARILDGIASMVHEWQKERTVHQNELHRLQTALELSQQIWKKWTQNFLKKYIISNANCGKRDHDYWIWSETSQAET